MAQKQEMQELERGEGVWENIQVRRAYDFDSMALGLVRMARVAGE